MKKLFRFFSVAVAVAIAFTACQKSPKTVTIDFEGSAWDALIDNPQNGGPLIYGTYNADTWTDAATTLGFEGFPDYYGSRCFSSGGEVISNYVVADYTGADYNRQLEVPVAPSSGKNFVVHYGSEDPSKVSKGSFELAPAISRIRFADNSERVIESVDVCLTNYMLNSCINGDGMFGPISGATTISIKAIGFKANGTATLSSTVKLIDGADAAAYKAGTKKIAWNKWDLSVLGAVNGIVFCVLGTDDCYGDYGFNAPAYFAYDNIVVEEPEQSK